MEPGTNSNYHMTATRRESRDLDTPHEVWVIISKRIDLILGAKDPGDNEKQNIY
jgi:hypothetical protein